MHYINEMLTSMKGSGLQVENVIFDGLLHNVPTYDKPSQNAGWYLAFINGKTILFGNGITGVEKIYTIQTKITKLCSS